MKSHWGVSNTEGDKIKDSYYIHLLEQEELEFGEHCKVEFKYKFSDDVRFEKKIKVGDISKWAKTN